MAILGWIGWGLSVLINLYMMVLFARVILDWVQFFARGWRPSGILLVLANVLYALTDPPMDRALRSAPAPRWWHGNRCRFHALIPGAYRWAALRYFPVLFEPVAPKKGDERSHKNDPHLVMDVASVTISVIIFVT
mgnify:CR=1 FL=1